MTASPETFGAFLVRQQLVSQPKIEEAIQNQGILGGRLGTNLVEIGALHLETLEQHLAAYLGLLPVGPKDLDQVNPHLLQTIPKRLVQKCKFIPLSKNASALQIAVMNAPEMTVRQEIEGVLAMKVQPVIASEIRLMFYLDQYYGIPAEIRYRSLYFHYRKERALGKDVPMQRTGDEGRIDLIKKGFKPLEKGEELTDAGFEEFLLQAEMSRIKPPTVAVTPPAPAVEFADLEELEPIKETTARDSGPLTFDDLDKALENLRERNDIGDLALRFAAQFVPTAVLFVVNSGLVSGWLARGKHLTKDNVKGIILPQAGDSVLQTLLEGKNHFMGRLSPKPLNQRLLAALGMPAEENILLVPVFMKKKPVNILLATNGTGSIDQPSMTALLKLGQWLPRAYEQIILKRKSTFSDSLKTS